MMTHATHTNLLKFAAQGHEPSNDGRTFFGNDLQEFAVTVITHAHTHLRYLSDSINF